MFMRLLAVIFVVSLVSSCGFSPVYKKDTHNANMSEKLASIDFEEPDNINERIFASRLQDLLNPTSISVPNEHIIEYKIGSEKISLVVERDRTTTRYKIIVTASYKIRDISTNKVISKAIVKREGEYDRVESDYATYVSENDAEERIIRELAEDVKIRIISSMLRHK